MEPVPFSTLQIEHVMPQTLTDSWKEALGEAVTQWDDQSILSRAEVLADRALQVWSYFGQEQSELDSLVSVPEISANVS